MYVMITRKSFTNNLLHYAVYHNLRLRLCAIVFRKIAVICWCYRTVSSVFIFLGVVYASFSLLSRDSVNKFLIAISVNKWLL